jgi:hypothetical protein
MSNNPPYPPAGGDQPPYGPPPGQGQPPQGPPQGGYPSGQPGQPGQPAYGAPYAQPGFAPPNNRPSKKWYKRWWVWVVAAIAVIIIAFFVFAAIFGNKYQLESKIKDAYKDQGATASDVSCPSNIETDKGNTYTCTATVNGKETSVLVTFVNDGNFTLEER